MSAKHALVRTLFIAVTVVALGAVGTLPAHAAGIPGDDGFLDTASAFSVIGGSTVTNTGSSVLDASLAVSPGSAVTGFPPGLSGPIHSNDAVAIQAQLDVTTAANAIMAVPSYDIGSGDLDGLLFKAGAYSSATSLLNAGTITLDGDADDVFIFTAVSSLTTGSGSTIIFTSGAQACNVFWRVGSSGTLGTGSHFAGTLIAQAAISANTLATISGRLFAQTAAVTLQSNVFTAPACVTSGGNGDRWSDVPAEEGETVESVGPALTAPTLTAAGPTGPVLPIPRLQALAEGGGGTGEGGALSAAAITSLAATGADSAPILGIGAGLVGAGVLLFAYRRRVSIRANRGRRSRSLA